jgi:hypothetical protein
MKQLQINAVNFLSFPCVCAKMHEYSCFCFRLYVKWSCNNHNSCRTCMVHRWESEAQNKSKVYGTHRPVKEQ